MYLLCRVRYTIMQGLREHVYQLRNMSLVDDLEATTLRALEHLPSIKAVIPKVCEHMRPEGVQTTAVHSADRDFFGHCAEGCDRVKERVSSGRPERDPHQASGRRVGPAL